MFPGILDTPPASPIANQKSKIKSQKSALRFFTRQQHGHRMSKTPVFSKTPIFTLLLPYFHPTFTLPPNRHHRVSASESLPRHSFLCGRNWDWRSRQPAPRRALFQKPQFPPRIHPGFTPDLPCIPSPSARFRPPHVAILLPVVPLANFQILPQIVQQTLLKRCLTLDDDR